MTDILSINCKSELRRVAIQQADKIKELEAQLQTEKNKVFDLHLYIEKLKHFHINFSKNVEIFLEKNCEAL